MDDIIRIIKSLESVDLLIVVGGVSQIVKHEIIKQEGGFLDEGGKIDKNSVALFFWFTY